MKWTSKITCIVVFLSSLLLIFAMGRTNVRHFKEVQSSIEGIYKDRLVVNALIFELSSLLHKKQIAITANDESFFGRINASTNLQIEEYLREFRETYLTEFEEKTLNRFEEGLKQLYSLEKKVTNTNKNITILPFSQEIQGQISSLQIDLRTLLDIQLSEGKRKLNLSGKAVEAMDLNQTIENYSILIIGLLILGILLIPQPKISVRMNE